MTKDDAEQSKDAGLGDAAKWLAGSIPVAVAALSFAGLSGDALGRTARVYPVIFVLGFLALVAAVVAGVSALFSSKFARAWLGIGLVAFVLGVATLVVTHAASKSKQDRPTVTAGLARDAQGFTAKVTVSADGLRPSEYLFVVVQGLNSEYHLEPNLSRLANDQTPIPNGEYSKQRIYSGRIGASPSGHATSAFEVALAKDLYDQYVVQAAILSGTDNRAKEEELLFGEAVTGRFKCGPETSYISCITVLLPTPHTSKPRP